MAYELPDLPYPYDALEPHVDARTMEIHHTKHHAGYVKKVNAALESHPDLQDRPIHELLTDIETVPEAIRTAVRNNGGGHANHSLFWSVMAPGAGGEPGGALAQAIEAAFGDFSSFQDKFSTTAASRFGSGWGWLALEDSGELKVFSTPNQDSPWMDGLKPILGIDVWEHAYYLKYQNRRADYISAWWNVVNWAEVEELFESLKG